MFLKRLEMIGFKSFADKTFFSLTPGVTVIVGPNGCGKSNITDAIRWVLGEQSAKHLRGMRMDDIIFNGTTSRKALSFAEVSLTFDHTDGILGLDYQEITVTRRIYRSGESEYMLNKRSCRLKDILELFMDSGVGKEAYSIIEQGRIDEIITAKPEERRQIFEEAAGILKYKSRKREAQRRLAETAENLLRVGDIIAELSLQLGPLAIQAEQAKSFLSFRDALKIQDVDMLVSVAQEKRTKWYDTDKKVKTAADELLEQQTAVNKCEANLANSQLKLDEEQTIFSANQRQVQQIASELERVESHIAVSLERLNNVDRQLLEGQQFLEELKKQRATLTEEKQRTLQSIASVHLAITQTKQDLQSAQHALAAFETSAESLRTQALQDELDKLLLNIRRQQTEHDRLEMDHIQLLKKTVAIQKQQTEKQHEYEDLQAQLAKLTGILQQHHRQKQQLLDDIDNVQKNTIHVQNNIEKLQQQLQHELKLLSQSQNQLQVLQELKSAMAGYHQGVKTVLMALKSGEHLEGIYGTVADLITVPAKFVTAIETALGIALQNLVVENENAAKNAITYLKKVKGGRATFLPLNILSVQKDRPQLNELTNLSGYIGIAADLIEFKEQFKPAIESLLARTHLVNDMDAALAAARILNFRERVVTLDGDVMMPGGAMSGGYDKRQGGVLTRRKEEAKVQQLILSQQASIKKLQQDAVKLTANDMDLSSQKQHLQEKLQQIDLALGLTKQELTHLTKQTETVNTSMQILTAELQAVEYRASEREPVLKTVTAQLVLALQKESALRVELAHLSGRLAAREQEKRSLQEQYTECRVHMASYQQQLNHHEAEVERILRELTHLQTKHKQKIEEIDKVKVGRFALTGTIAQDQEKAALIKQQYNHRVTELMEKENALKLLNTLYREQSEQLRQLEKSQNALERKQTRCEMERDRLESDMQRILDRLRDSWDLEFAIAEKLAMPVSDKKAAQESIQELKAQMQALGTVNLGAIDEYERVAERVEFLLSQRTDLQAGENDLLRIIGEIDKRMGEKFTTSFTIINDNFSQIFKELFGGGRAQLRLTEPDNPLEAGVEIVAQPPGKKLQHMTLLSGGEKALTAIALLFAFLQMRHTPFCILDEIEAALDDANLARFCNYLGTYSDNTQFILITHRKKTMEQADILYGVTMEEPGVSKLISVRLRDNKNTDSVSA